MGTLWQDLRYGARMLLKKPGFTFVAVITLALGIGANTAIFSVVNAVLLRPLPYPQPQQLVWIWETNPKNDIKEEPASVPNFADWRSQNGSFSEMAAFSGTAPVLTDAGEPERLPGTAVTANFFAAVGVGPALGRGFVDEENTPGKNRVVILSHGLWQRRFNADPKTIGGKITLNGNSYEVVGVMPPGFKNPQPDEARPTELWLPLALNPAEAGRRSDFLKVVARLKPGVSITQARGEMETITKRLAEQYPQTNYGWGVTILPLHERVVGDLRPALWTLTGAVGFLLLIACGNVANLLLARAASRKQEIAVRTALGAGRGRLVRQFLTESVLLSLGGGVTGLVVGWWGIELLVALSPGNIPRLGEVALSGQVFAFTFTLAVLTGIIFGLVPALHATNPNLNESLKEGGRGSTDGVRSGRLRGALVVSEIALALVMLVGAGLMARSFLRLQDVDPGFKPERVVAALVSLPISKYPDGPQVPAFYHQLLERVRAVPGVESAALGSAVPLNGGAYNTFFIEGRPVPRPEDDQPDADYLRVSRDYFTALGIQLIRGENFAERYADDAPGVAIISQSFARKYFPTEDPIGKRVTTGNPQPPPGQTVPWRTIIAVVADTPSERLDAPRYPQLYVPF
ncbi:MAG TPA: ABC transporter permease, partial [Pyrinomonadaceae bacterium]|nr:ABC transporter permease [Pyrinomonadaceae bacterium]